MRVLAPLVVVLALLLAACGGGASSDGAAGVAVALQFPPRAGYAFDADDGGLLTKLGVAEPLVALDRQGNPVPGLATSWTQDGASWRFVLRDGVTFHDGARLDANAVVTALTYVLGRPAPPRAITDIGLQVTAEGPMTVRATTTAPDPVLPLRLSSGSTSILSPAAYGAGASAATGDGAAQQPPPVNTATGPLRMTEVRGTEGATLERFDGYWGATGASAATGDGAAKAARVDVRYVSDPQTRELALRSGDVGFAEGLPETSRAGLRADPSVTFSEFPSARTILLQLNQSAPPFADLRVRRAVTAALDRTVLADQVLGGSALPASDLFGPAVPYGSTQAPPAADVAGARGLLAQAGYSDLNPLRVRLWTFPNRPELPVLAQAIASQLQAAGVVTEITVGEYDAQEPEVLAGRYDMFLNSRSYLSDFPDAAGTLSSDYTSGGSYAIDQYRSPAFDALVAQLGTVTDPVARTQLYRRAAAQLVTDAVGVPIVHPRNTAAEKGVTGFVPDPLDLRPVLPALAPVG